MAYTVAPDNATDKTATYKSSDESVATVGTDGTVTGVKAGTTTITITVGGKTAAVAITVAVPASTGTTE